VRVGSLVCNGLHDDQVCATVVLLRNAAVVAAAILHPLVNIMMLRSGASGAKKGGEIDVRLEEKSSSKGMWDRSEDEIY
jgi:hypothetical protein